ncbi:MAG TPA: hypothetical protein DCP02_04955 [Actinobacteria bacterium]|nr:hypothetical protein [Actinomycetota bacterium]
MNRFFKVIIIGIAMLVLAGCSTRTPVENTKIQDNDTETEAVESEATEEITEDKITLENLTEEQLKAFTGLDADYAEFLEESAIHIHFLKSADEGVEIKGTVIVFQGSGKDSTALYIYDIEGEVIDARLDEFNGSIAPGWVEADYLFYSFSSMMEKQPSEESLDYDGEKRSEYEAMLRESFEGQPLYRLHEKLNIYVPVYRYESLSSPELLDTYMIVSEVGYTASTDVNVIYDIDGTIKRIYLDDSYGPGKQDPLKELQDG